MSLIWLWDSTLMWDTVEKWGFFVHWKLFFINVIPAVSVKMQIIRWKLVLAAQSRQRGSLKITGDLGEEGLLRAKWCKCSASTNVLLNHYKNIFRAKERKKRQKQRKRNRLSNAIFGLTHRLRFRVHTDTDLSHAATSPQGAAGLAEVIIIPVWQRWACTSDAVQVVQAAVIGELSERRKTAGKGGVTWEERQDKGDVLRI